MWIFLFQIFKMWPKLDLKTERFFKPGGTGFKNAFQETFFNSKLPNYRVLKIVGKKRKLPPIFVTNLYPIFQFYFPLKNYSWVKFCTEKRRQSKG